VKKFKVNIVGMMLSVIVISMIAMVILSGCGEKEVADDSRVAKIKAAGVLVVLMSADLPPYEYSDENGDIVGLDVNIANLIADELGVTLKIRDVDFDTIVPAIAEGDGDLAVTALRVTPEREELIDYSVPYIDTYQTLVVSKDSDIVLLDDLANRNVGAQSKSTGDVLMLNEINGEKGMLVGKGTNLTSYETDNYTAIDELIAGKYDALVIGAVASQEFIRQYPGLKIIPLKTSEGKEFPEVVAVGVQKGQPALVDVVNVVIRRLIADGSISKWEAEFSTSEIQH
jgi:polar amino acid transport system substrate-binding protein